MLLCSTGERRGTVGLCRIGIWRYQPVSHLYGQACAQSSCAEQANQGYAEAQQASRETRLAVLRDAEVVVSTLIAAGGDLLSLSAGQPGFDAIIIDEASHPCNPAASDPVLI